MNIENGLTRKQVAELLDIPAQTIAFYANKKMVIPEIANPKGRGTTRKYSKKNLVEFILIKLLGGLGVHLTEVGIILAALRDSDSGDALKLNDRVIINIYNDLTDKFQCAWSFDITTSIQELKGSSILMVDLIQVFKKVEDLLDEV